MSQGKRISLVEAMVVMIVIGATLALLVPSLSLSREHARATMCQNNLRRLTRALDKYFDNSSRNSLAKDFRWPTELCKIADPDYEIDESNIEHEKRPPLLTCPSHPAALENLNDLTASHYVLIYEPLTSSRSYPHRDDSSTRSPTAGISSNAKPLWAFRDQAIHLILPKLESDTEMVHWMNGPVISFQQAENQLLHDVGPHENGVFHEGFGDGQVVSLQPKSEFQPPGAKPRVLHAAYHAAPGH